MKSADIVVVGTGSLAAGVAHSLCQAADGPLRVAVIGRDAAKVSRLTRIANARAAAFGRKASFESVELAQFKALAFSRAFRSLRPKVIFQAASLQSPWEAGEGQNAWTRLLATAGFGVTLPLQMVLAAEVSRGAVDTEAAIINASYPDCVNVALHKLGLRITCGIGNAAIVEAFCRSTEKTKHADVRVIGHHGHLSAWLKGKRASSQPRVWVQGREIDGQRLRPNLEAIEEDLNDVTAATAVVVILAMLSGETLHQSIPGVAGLPGGYPFEVKRRKFALRLPKGITLEEAVAHNKSGEHLDGVDVGSSVKFSGRPGAALAAANFEYAAGFDLGEWPTVSERMLALRNRLRSLSL